MTSNVHFPLDRIDVTAARAALERHLLKDAGRELRRCLWSIMASSQLLLRSRELSPRDARLADRIDAAAHCLGRMARDLLDEAMVHGGLDLPLELQPTILRAIAHEALLEARVDYPDRWIVEAGAGDGALDCDRLRMTQALANLLAYALDRSSDATPVSFAWWGKGEEVVVEVEFSPEPAQDRTEWTLGLAVACAIVAAHGGSLDLHLTRWGRQLRVALPRRATGRDEQELAAASTLEPADVPDLGVRERGACAS